MNSYQQQQQIQPNMQMGSGLTRYRSVPSSCFDTILSNTTSDGSFGADDFARLFNPRASSPETQRIFTRFMNSAGAPKEDCSQDLTPQPQSQPQLNSQFPTPRQHQLQRQHSKGYSSVSTMMYRSDHNFEAANSAVESSFERLPGSIDSEQIKMEGGGNISALTRHGTSPAGLFASVGFPINPLDDSAILSDDFLKGLAEEGNKTFGTSHASDDQNKEAENQPPTLLSRHLSLPKGSADLSATDKLLLDSVPCHLRAKRGCATHPRSIAERVRRNRISERTRKLQELVPNMEKQTNTADMLDLAFDYIKDLQRQVKTLSDNRAKCSCSARMKP